MATFNFVYYMTIVFSIMYLFSSGLDYMKYEARLAGRSHLVDKLQLAATAGFAFIGAFHPQLSNNFNYILYFPLLGHLLQIAYLSYKFKNKK